MSLDRSDDSKDAILVRLELHVDGKQIKDGEMTLARIASVEQRSGDEIDEEHLGDLARRMYESRRLRAKYLSNSLLGEPVWDMMLALYCVGARGEAISVSGLCQWAEVPATTALRWVQLMEQKELISRTRDRSDARRAFVSLTAHGKAVMDNYLESVSEGLRG